jgi:RHS repeat-associated protein
MPVDARSFAPEGSSARVSTTSGVPTINVVNRIAPIGGVVAGALATSSVPPGTEKNPPLPNGASAGIGVQTATGNFSSTVQDMAIAGRGPAPAVLRTYNSNDTFVSPLGIGWTHSYNLRLHLADDASGAVFVVGEQGRRDRYTPVGGGNYSAPAGITASLTQLPDTSWSLRSKDQTTWAFNGDGRLVGITDRFGNSSLMTYNGSGQLATVSDPAGRGVLTFAYHAVSGRLISVSDWMSPARVVAYGYDASNRLNSVTDRAGGVTQYTYDANSRLATIIDPNSNTALTVAYDTQGRVSSQKDAKGLVTGRATTFGYVDNGDGTTTTTVTYPVTSFEPTWSGKIIDTAETHGWLTRRVTQPSSTESSTTLLTYDAAGNLATLTDPRSNTTKFCYDTDYLGGAVPGSVANLTRVIAPQPPPLANPFVTLFKYDAKNNVVESVAPMGVLNGSSVTCSTNLSTAINPLRKTVSTYDASATFLLSVTSQFTDPDTGLKTVTDKFEYGDSANPGLLTRTIPPRGNTGGSPNYAYARTFTYFSAGSQAGLLQSATDPLGNKVTHTYDSVGRLSSTVDQIGNAASGVPAEHTWSYVYDNEDRLSVSTAPAPTVGTSDLVTETLYDAAGNRTAVIDANGQVTKFLYDSRNLLSETQESPSVWTNPTLTPSPLFRTTYGYDDAGLLTRVTRAAGDALHERATDTAHDGLFRLRRETQYPQWPLTIGALVTSYAYDASGNLQSTTDALSKTTTYGYDTLDRLVAITYTDGTPNVTYAYDQNSNRTSMVDGMGTTTYARDELDRLTSVTSPTEWGPRTIGYRYDLDGNRAKIIYPDSTAVAYTFDNAGRMASLIDWGSRTTSYTYYPDSRVSGMTTVNATNVSYIYDNARRVKQITQTRSGNTILQQLYTLDPTGNRTMVQDLVSHAGASLNLSWGRNDYGQLGDGTTIDRNSPTPVGGLSTVERFSAGQYHSAAQMPDQSVRVWGRNDQGQLGDGTNTDRLSPAAIPNFPPPNSSVTSISAGANHTVASVAFSEGYSQAYAWGDNSAGQLGDGTFTDRNSPVLVTGNTCGCPGGVSAGWKHSLAQGNGAVWAWGDNTYGQLGDGTTVSRSSMAYVQGVGGIGALYALNISAGHSHSLAVDEYGKVYAWGRNDSGQLGDGTLSNATTPVPVMGPDGVTQLGGVAWVQASHGSAIGGGGGYSIAVKADGSVWAWGDNTYGQLGDGTTTRRPFAVRVGGPSFGSVKAISAGGSHVVASKTDGTVWTWGRNELGQLGRTSAETCEASVPCSKSPGQIPGISNIGGVFTRFDHTIVTTTSSAITRYSYDQLYRLTSDGTMLYTYDPVGNRKSTTLAGTTTSYSYDRADRITSAPYVIDAAGNMTRRPDPSGSGVTHQLTYDQANRPTFYWHPSVWASYYTYNGDGLLGRIRVSSGAGGNADYLYDVNRSFPVVLQDAWSSEKYVWGLGILYGKNDNDPYIRVMHADALSSIRSLTDANGNVTQTYQRNAFGARTSTSGTSAQPFDFTGELRDTNTGLIYLRARMYDPQIGRFLSRDTFAGSGTSSQSQHRYSYAANNPTTFRDPSGRAIPDDGAGSCMCVPDDELVVGSTAIVLPVSSSETLEPPACSGSCNTNTNTTSDAQILVSSVVQTPLGATTVVAALNGRAAGALPGGGGGGGGGRGGDSIAAAFGRHTHRAVEALANSKAGWEGEFRMQGKSGKWYRIDVLTPSSRFIELKPNTPSGRRAGARQAAIYKRELGLTGRVMYYDRP